MDKSSSKSLRTYTETKHHPRANKFQSKTYHTNSPATQEHSHELQYTGCPVTPNPLTYHNSLLDTSLHSREKKSSSTHQKTNTSFPNQETFTSHPYNPTPSEEIPQSRELHTCQNTESPPQTQQYKQDEKTEEYPAGKGTG